ncbi:13782_t:CDS:2 [Acaulospora morrowiae]|uniref:13782_t:CDS:1 n=1 Tax=Acaulospora morrowiae TaxID=94023 RepID=A0A9N9CDN1_9GLOM|nr:13782_t:CDS:2 [Acaulospora morrowiae]
MSNTDEIYSGRTGKHVNRTLIINSPPFRDQWNTFDSTWNKRFVQAGKELLDVTLGEAFERKVISFHIMSLSGPSNGMENSLPRVTCLGAS